MAPEMRPNQPVIQPIFGEDVPFPPEADFLADQDKSDQVRFLVERVLEAHVTRSGPHDIRNEVEGNVYKETHAGGQIIETPNGQIRVTVQKKPMSNGKKGAEGDYHDVMETIVEPVDGEVKETEICLGGYSINTPAYYQDFFPYALTGKRFVFINLLGGGTDGYQERNLNASWFGGEAAFENSYYPESGAHIADLIDRYAKEGQTMTLSGESTGGLVLEHVLANQDYLPTKLLKKINRVVLDAPVPTGRLPYGNWGTMSTTAKALWHGQLGAVAGWESTVGAKMLGTLMMTDLKREASQGDANARRIIEQVTEACFRATGAFPHMALHFDKRDPMVDVMTSTEADDVLRRAALADIDFNIFYRPGDKTLPQKKILAMAQRWAACGLNIVLAPGEIHSNSHMDLPGMNPQGVWRQHGVNRRLQPFQPMERQQAPESKQAPEINFPISD